MATLRPDQVRARVAGTLEGLGVTAGTLEEAPCGYDGFPGAVPRVRAHLAFAVAVTSTTIEPVQRQRQSRELRVRDSVSVRLLHRLRDSDEVADIDSAMATEADAIAAVLGTAGTTGLQTVYAGTSTRQAVEVDGGRFYMLQLDFAATRLAAVTLPD